MEKKADKEMKRERERCDVNKIKVKYGAVNIIEM